MDDQDAAAAEDEDNDELSCSDLSSDNNLTSSTDDNIASSRYTHSVDTLKPKFKTKYRFQSKIKLKQSDA